MLVVSSFKGMEGGGVGGHNRKTKKEKEKTHKAGVAPLRQP